MKVCLSAGGTGGHVYPAVTMAKYLKQKGDSFFFIGNQNQMEEKVCQEHGFRFLAMEVSGINNSTFKSRIKAIIPTIKGFRTARNYLKDEKPDLVVALGGYVTLSVVIAAYTLKIPVLLHEQNALPGRANKFLVKFARGIALSYESSRSYFEKYNPRVIGNPRASEAIQRSVDSRILEDYGLSLDQPILYLVMGSLGSGSMNRFYIDLFNQFDFKDFQVLISGGVKNTNKLKQALGHLDHIHIFEQVDQVGILPFCSMVVSRAGATGIAELMAVGSVTILVPSPYVADNHQYYNALDLVQREAALMLDEKTMTGQELYDLIMDLMNNAKKREQLSHHARQLGYPQASTDFYQWMEEIVNE